MKRMLAVMLSLCLFTPCLFAAEASLPYCYSVAVDLGDGEIIDSLDGLPAYFVFHLQVHADNTYEGLYFGAKTSGAWTAGEGEEYILTVDKTLDPQLGNRHRPGQPAFVLAPDEDGDITLMEIDDNMIIYLEEADEKYDEDAILERMEEMLLEGE